MTFDPVQVMRRETARFAEALRDVDGNTPVPTCPGWDADELLWHLTEVHLFWSAVIASGATTDEQIEDIEKAKPLRPTGRSEALELLRRATDELGTALSSGDDRDSAWSWFPADQTIGFTRRMQTHEATIHRVDAELTAGLPVSDIPIEVAVAGIDHVLDVMWNWVPGDVEQHPLGVIELRPRGGGSRLVELYRWSGRLWGRDFADQVAGRRADHGAEPRAVISGEAADLDRLVWSRPAISSREGDLALLAAFDELIAFGIQ